jgi:hypothetical protein
MALLCLLFLRSSYELDVNIIELPVEVPNFLVYTFQTLDSPRESLVETLLRYKAISLARDAT